LKQVEIGKEFAFGRMKSASSVSVIASSVYESLLNKKGQCVLEVGKNRVMCSALGFPESVKEVVMLSPALLRKLCLCLDLHG
jgi:ribonuclease PH